MQKSKTNVPLGLLLITLFYIFGAVVLLIFLFADPVQTTRAIAGVHGLPLSTGKWILPFLAGLALLIAYGLFSLSRWGYLLSIIYLAYFGTVNALLLRPHNEALYLGNLLWSILVILYLFLIHSRFRTE